MLKPIYPALLVSQFGLSCSAKPITTSLKSWIDCDGFDGETIIDSTGQRFKIVGVQEHGPAFAPFSNWFRRDGDKVMKISLDLEPMEPITLDELKDFLIQFFEDRPELKQDEHAHAYLVADIKYAESIGEICDFGFAEGPGTPEEIERARRKAKSRP